MCGWNNIYSRVYDMSFIKLVIIEESTDEMEEFKIHC